MPLLAVQTETRKAARACVKFCPAVRFASP